MDLSTALLQRIFAAHGTSKLADCLKRIKGSDEQIPRSAFRTTGTREQLEEAARTALQSGYLSNQDLAKIVDTVEENGGQHIFLFRLTAAGRKALTKTAMQTAKPEPEASTVLYSDSPTTRLFFVDREDEGFGLKQVLTSEYWELDRDRSKDTENERVTWYVKRRRRAVNLMLVRPEAEELEVRIDRVRSGQDDRLATRNYQTFESAMVGLFDRAKHTEQLLFTPSQFAKMVAAKGETYMTVDEAEDGEFSQRISNTRERTKGTDVRDYERWGLSGKGFKRSSLNIYWRIGDDERVHSILSNVPLLVTDEPTLEEIGAKVYVHAKIPPLDLRHVIDRIRHFAS